MKQRSLFDLEDAQPSEAAPKAMEMPLPKMVRGSVYQPDYDAVSKAKPSVPVGASCELTCAYCGARIWSVSVTTTLSGNDYRGHAVHHTPELVWLAGGGFGWVWFWHARYCKKKGPGGVALFNEEAGHQ